MDWYIIFKKVKESEMNIVREITSEDSVKVERILVTSLDSTKKYVSRIAKL